MKFLKGLFKVLAVVIVLVLVVSFFLPSEVHVERSTSIDAPAEAIFTQVNELQNWKNWSPWSEMDAEMVMGYSMPSNGAGAYYTWESENDKVGNGKLMIVESIPNESIKTSLDFDEEGTGQGAWVFTANENGGTDVTWSMDTDMGNNPMGKIFGLMMDKMVGPMFEKGLMNIKNLTEEMASPAADGDMEA